MLGFSSVPVSALLDANTNSILSVKCERFPDISKYPQGGKALAPAESRLKRQLNAFREAQSLPDTHGSPLIIHPAPVDNDPMSCVALSKTLQEQRFPGAFPVAVLCGPVD